MKACALGLLLLLPPSLAALGVWMFASQPGVDADTRWGAAVMAFGAMLVLDWFFLVSTQKVRRTWSLLLPVLLRGTVAVLLSTSFSVPLILALFKEDIDAHVAVQREGELRQAGERAAAERVEIAGRHGPLLQARAQAVREAQGVLDGFRADAQGAHQRLERAEAEWIDELRGKSQPQHRGNGNTAKASMEPTKNMSPRPVRPIPVLPPSRRSCSRLTVPCSRPSRRLLTIPPWLTPPRGPRRPGAPLSLGRRPAVATAWAPLRPLKIAPTPKPFAAGRNVRAVPRSVGRLRRSEGGRCSLRKRLRRSRGWRGGGAWADRARQSVPKAGEGCAFTRKSGSEGREAGAGYAAVGRGEASDEVHWKAGPRCRQLPSRASTCAVLWPARTAPINRALFLP